MEKLIVLDCPTLTIHIFNIDRDNVDDEYVETLGFNTNNCYWMVGNIDIFEHQGILI